MLERVSVARPEARLDGFILQAMISRSGALELLVGLIDDPVFGPLIAFGQGGTAVELVRDSSLEFPPLNVLLTRRLMGRTRVSQLLQGYRRKPPADIDAIVRVLNRVSQLAVDHPEIRELDINPLLADAARAIALDARVPIAPPRDPGTARLAIAPYPQDLASTEVLRDGTGLRVRPLRPEDEPLLHGLTAHMSAEDLRLRFFTQCAALPTRLQLGCRSSTTTGKWHCSPRARGPRSEWPISLPTLTNCGPNTPLRCAATGRAGALAFF